MIVHALIGGYQLVVVTAAHLHMLAYKTALGSALVVAAWVCIALHYLLTILTPPAMPEAFGTSNGNSDSWNTASTQNVLRQSQINNWTSSLRCVTRPS